LHVILFTTFLLWVPAALVTPRREYSQHPSHPYSHWWTLLRHPSGSVGSVDSKLPVCRLDSLWAWSAGVYRSPAASSLGIANSIELATGGLDSHLELYYLGDRPDSHPLLLSQGEGSNKQSQSHNQRVQRTYTARRPTTSKTSPFSESVAFGS